MSFPFRRHLAPALALVALFSWTVALADDSVRRSTTGDSTRVSVVADNASVRSVLQEVAEAAGIRLVLETALEERVAEESVSMTLTGLRPEEALRRLVPDGNLLLLYSEEGHLVAAHMYLAGHAPPASRAASPRSAKPVTAASRAPTPDGATTHSPGVDTRLVDRLRREAVTHPEAARRAAALEELTGLGDEALVRATAIEMLARERDPKALEATLDVVSTLHSVPLEQIAQFVAAARQPALRIQALDILGDRVREDSQVRAWLHSLSTSDGDDDVRSAARMALDRSESRAPDPSAAARAPRRE